MKYLKSFQLMNEWPNEVKEISNSQPGMGVIPDLPLPLLPMLCLDVEHFTLEFWLTLLKVLWPPHPIPTNSFKNHCKGVIFFLCVWDRENVGNHLDIFKSIQLGDWQEIQIKF